jgi:outer membrane protein assembly factor BamB
MAFPLVTAPIHYRGVLYLFKEGGLLTSVDPDTGEVLKKGRLHGALDEYFASPVAADGKLYLTSQDGHVVVVKAGAQWEILAANDVGHECFATLAEGRLYIRTTTTLHCLENVQSSLR